MSARRPLTIRSIRGPLILFVAALVLVVALLILWNVSLAVDYRRIRELMLLHEGNPGQSAFHWTMISVGSVLFVATIALLSVLGAQLFTQIRFSQRLSASIATFTHELNSPLASIKMFVQTLRRTPLPPEEQQRFLDRILIDVERLSRQISNTLQAAQLDSLLGFQIAPESTDLRAWLEDYLEPKRLVLERLEGTHRLELEPGPAARVQIDPHAFASVLDNLIDNAVKYARPGGVRIALRLLPLPDRPDRIALEVQDDGSGIPADELPQVFDRFGRGSNARRHGTGLGLWIVESIVEAHRGRVWASSPGLERGTTIRIELPCSQVSPLTSEEGSPEAEGRELPA